MYISIYKCVCVFVYIYVCVDPEPTKALSNRVVNPKSEPEA